VVAQRVLTSRRWLVPVLSLVFGRLVAYAYLLDERRPITELL
jgi:hypothetical protein